MNIAKPTDYTGPTYTHPTGKSVDNFTCIILIFGKEIIPGRHHVESGSNLKVMQWVLQLIFYSRNPNNRIILGR